MCCHMTNIYLGLLLPTISSDSPLLIGGARSCTQVRILPFHSLCYHRDSSVNGCPFLSIRASLLAPLVVYPPTDGGYPLPFSPPMRRSRVRTFLDKETLPCSSDTGLVYPVISISQTQSHPLFAHQPDQQPPQEVPKHTELFLLV